MGSTSTSGGAVVDIAGDGMVDVHAVHALHAEPAPGGSYHGHCGPGATHSDVDSASAAAVATRDAVAVSHHHLDRAPPSAWTASASSATTTSTTQTSSPISTASDATTALQGKHDTGSVRSFPLLSDDSDPIPSVTGTARIRRVRSSAQSLNQQPAAANDSIRTPTQSQTFRDEDGDHQMAGHPDGGWIDERERNEQGAIDDPKARHEDG